MPTLYVIFFITILITGMHLTWPLDYKGREGKRND